MEEMNVGSSRSRIHTQPLGTISSILFYRQLINVTTDGELPGMRMSYKKEKNYILLLSIISFFIGSFNFVGLELLKSTLPILLVSSVFSLMMIGHWFLVDPTISRVGMKNISIFSTSLSLCLSVLVFFDFYESSSNLFNLLSNSVLNNVMVFLYISAAILSFGSFKSLQEKSYTGVMASTGLSYLSLIVSLGASGTLILSI